MKSILTEDGERPIDLVDPQVINNHHLTDHAIILSDVVMNVTTVIDVIMDVTTMIDVTTIAGNNFLFFCYWFLI